MYKEIETVNGKISCDTLGFTLMHEHLIFNYNNDHRNQLQGYIRNILRDYINSGGKTIVELTPFRRMDWVLEALEGFDLNVILSTGCYTQKNCSKQVVSRSIKEHIAVMTREITEGIDNSNIRAGIIKIAGVNSNLTDFEIKHMTAAARVSVRTGVPIATHACCGAAAQQDLLEKSGADLSKVFFSHTEAEFGWEGRTLKEQAKWAEKIVQKGSSLLFNNFDYGFDTPKEDLTYLLLYLADKGYVGNLLMSSDFVCEYDEEDNRIYKSQEKMHTQEVEKRSMAYMITDIAGGYLREIGFSDNDIKRVFFDNPNAFFNK